MGNKFVKVSYVLLLIFIFLLFSSYNIQASYAVNTKYYNEKPLIMYPGESKEISFNLQNCPAKSPECEERNENISLQQLEGIEITEILSGTSYYLPYSSVDNYITLKVSIPESDTIGSSYRILLRLSSPPPPTNGTIQLGTSYDVGFPVLVKSQEEIANLGNITSINNESAPSESKNLTWIIIAIISLLIIGIIVVIILIIYFYRKEKYSLKL